MTTASSSTVEAVDLHVAARLRMARELRGVSLEKAAEVICKSHQQMSRLERGKHRLSPGELYLLARLYDVPMEYFFAGYQVDPVEQQRLRAVTGKAALRSTDEPGEQEALLMMLWRGLTADVRETLLDLMQRIPQSRRAPRR